MAKRAREYGNVQERVDQLLGDRAAARVAWNGHAIGVGSRRVLEYVAGGIAIVALRAGSPLPPLVGTVEVMLTLEETCVRVVCGVGERNVVALNTQHRIVRQDPTAVGRVEVVSANQQLNVGFCVALEDYCVVPDAVDGNDQILEIRDVLRESALPALRDAPLQVYPPKGDIF